MRLHGQLQPVVARVHHGGYQLIDGFKRYYAAEDLMMETLQCHVLEIDLSQAKVLLLSYNRHHQSMEAWEEAMVLAGSSEDIHSMDQRSLAQLTGYSRSWVSRRLSLIEKMDEDVSSEIMMGHLPQPCARVNKVAARQPGGSCPGDNHFGLTSRQSDTLVEAFLKAEDEEQQRYILTHPEQILRKDQEDQEEDPYDVRLSSYGNDLMQEVGYVIQSVQIMLSRLDDQRSGMLN